MRYHMIMTITIKLLESYRDHDKIVVRCRHGELNQEIRSEGNDTDSAKKNLELHFKAQYGDQAVVRFTLARARNGESYQGGD